LTRVTNAPFSVNAQCELHTLMASAEERAILCWKN